MFVRGVYKARAGGRNIALMSGLLPNFHVPVNHALQQRHALSFPTAIDIL